jgi:pyruvate dehydrogenase E2 component (dihydrolipoamide acetyltransferase)
VLKQYFNIGFAADTPNGLVVPVIRNVDQKGVLAIAAEMSALSAKAREGKLGPGRHAGRLLLHLEPGRHRRHCVHADHQCAGSRDPRRVEKPRRSRCGTARPSRRGSCFRSRSRTIIALIDGAAPARFTAYLAMLLADLRRVML